MQAIKAIITDIEGTTTPVSFVHKTLFPYAQKKLAHYLTQFQNEAAIKQIWTEVAQIENKPNLSLNELIEVMLQWIKSDQKITPLKTLQGLIWESGYAQGDFTAPVYPDAAEKLTDWHKQGHKLYVYSSGSIKAQKLLFKHSDQGDLCPLFSNYFDTTSGPKLEQQSYTTITQSIGRKPEECLFLSDHPGECQAAIKANLNSIQLCRPDNPILEQANCLQVTSFNEINMNKG